MPTHRSEEPDQPELAWADAERAEAPRRVEELRAAIAHHDYRYYVLIVPRSPTPTTTR